MKGGNSQWKNRSPRPDRQASGKKSGDVGGMTGSRGGNGTYPSRPRPGDLDRRFHSSQLDRSTGRPAVVYEGFKYTSRVVLTKFVIVREREMEQTKKHRSVLRSAFTKKANELDQLITAEVKDMQQIQVAWEILQQKYDALVVSESKVYGALLAQDASEEDLELEMESSDVYRVRFTTMKLRFKKGAHDEEVRSVLQSEQLSTRYQIEDLLRVWQRSTEFSSGRRSDDVDSIVPEDSTLDSRLKGLMSF
ncbi:hypothetical protein JTB14_009403 [Gonioctena quinquepunctata]|nr:hypothetical protein JTB14_009403 [Gonioctena quinquepunctata]